MMIILDTLKSHTGLEEKIIDILTPITKPRYLNLQIDKHMFVVHYILSNTVFSYRAESKDLYSGGNIPLMAEYFKDHIGRDYKEVINRLQEHGIINVSRSYEVGKKAKRYSICTKYANACVVDVDYKDLVFKEKIQSHSDNLSKNQTAKERTAKREILARHKSLVKKLKGVSLPNISEHIKENIIEKKRNYQYIQDNAFELDQHLEEINSILVKDVKCNVENNFDTIESISLSLLSKALKNMVERINSCIGTMVRSDENYTLYSECHKVVFDYTESIKKYHQCVSLEYTLSALNSGNIGKYCTTDSYGRFHSPFVNLPRTMRSLIIIDGEKSVGLDIKNSQPAFMVNLISKLDSEVDTEQLNRFSDLIFKGTLYEHMMGAVGYGGSRDTFKGSMFNWLFGQVGRYNYNQLSGRIANQINTYIKKEFPSIYSWCKRIKTEGQICKGRVKRTDKPYAILAVEMQKVESDLVLSTVAKRIKKEVKGMSYFTVHDAIYVTESNAKQCKIIFEECLKEFGIRSTIS